ncbi:MAG TPA: cytochrome o ubiquinol oxidase subunit IV [Novosphingobium sp.]|nr:cytochrome o ubiquinol oxidase subunit IV [Novosphingobium sp.]
MADHSHAHGHDDHGPAFHASLRDYVVGFILSVILTAIPFWLVMSGAIADHQTAGLVITAFAAVQIVVHMVYFLHMSGKVEGGWNLLALIFTGILVMILLSGTLWVMFHLNHNMMPVKMDGMG